MEMSGALSCARLRSPAIRFSRFPPWNASVPLFRSPLTRTNVARSAARIAAPPLHAAMATKQMNRRSMGPPVLIRHVRNQQEAGRISESHADADLHALRIDG